MPTVLITGSSGLVGSECVRHFSSLGWDVHGTDNNGRMVYFGRDGDTVPNMRRLKQQSEHFSQWFVDVSNRESVKSMIAAIMPDLIIHAAAQPSHDWAASEPFIDFDVNAGGTLNLLEATRQFAPKAAFCFLSTNKVYGDAPNEMSVEELPTRYDLTGMGNFTRAGFDETLRTDQSTHSLFGCSKLAADLYVQEYGRYFGMNTVSFRCGCLTGGAHAGTEQHGFLAYLAKCCREGRKYTVYGYKGKQVRDQLHAVDVARACEQFCKSPRQGDIYNLGGGRDNSVSVLEAIELVEKATGKKLDWTYSDQVRKGDHRVWVSDCTKFREHYPEWSVTRSLDDIIEELCAEVICS